MNFDRAPKLKEKLKENPPRKSIEDLDRETEIRVYNKVKRMADDLAQYTRVKNFPTVAETAKKNGMTEQELSTLHGLLKKYTSAIT